jgi:hypothetical protein
MEGGCILYQIERINLKLNSQMSSTGDGANKRFLKQAEVLFAACVMLIALFHLLICPEDGANMFIRNAGWFSPDYTVLYPRI